MTDQLFETQKDNFYRFRPFRVPKYQIKFENAGKLSDIPNYVWYSPAAIYLWGRYTDVNLSDIVSQKELDIFWYKFDRPIFSGFVFKNDLSWNHTLWAARSDQWDKLVDGILESVQFDIPNKKLYQYALQTIRVFDPLYVDRQRIVDTKTPKIDVHSFAVLSNVGQYAFDTRKPLKAECPGMVTFPADKVHEQAATRLFSIPGLEQDEAFEVYKKILIDTQDKDYENRVNRFRNARRK